jgi:hypothetical protein
MPKEKAGRSRAVRAEWEVVAEGTDRLTVPGGWIYRTARRGAASTTCFVPEESADAARMSALQHSARELKQKLEQLKLLLDQLSASRTLGGPSTRSTKVH